MIQLVPGDCDDQAVIDEAAGMGLLNVFGSAILDALVHEHDEGDEEGEDPYDQHDLDDVCWETYPEPHRGLLRAYGRPDYEHPDAAAYNRALIASEAFLRDTGRDAGGEFLLLREYLWRALFGDDPPAVVTKV